jgi:hypothetical protein
MQPDIAEIGHALSFLYLPLSSQLRGDEQARKYLGKGAF